MTEAISERSELIADSQLTTPTPPWGVYKGGHQVSLVKKYDQAKKKYSGL